MLQELSNNALDPRPNRILVKLRTIDNERRHRFIDSLAAGPPGSPIRNFKV